MFISFLIGWYYANSVKRKKINIPQKEIRKFPIKFLFSSTIIKFSEIAFFTLDVILAKHFLSPIEAGEYALISLVGKMIFFIGGLFGQFILPLVSKEEGAKGKSKIIFYKLLFVSTAFSFMAYLFVGVFGKYTGPILFGQKIIPVVYLMPLFGLAMLGFQIADNIVSFEQARNKHFFAVVSLLIAFAQLIGIAKFHTNLDQFVWVMTAIGLGNLTIMLFFHFTYDYLRDFFKPVSNNLLDFISLFTTHVNGSQIKNKKILIYNWRDIKHDWAGGAEVYLHELAKRWVKMGYSVTIFCGNDGHDLRHEIIDGVKVIRRGGFYMVYFWAFLYYIFLFRGKYDIIIDSENGIPFFTPIYTRKKVFLLIHHVHQEVFQVNLKPPLSWIGAFLEKRLMPLVYRNTEVITVSPSSKADILDYHLTQKDPHVIYNGVDLKKYTPGAKSLKPMVLYLGRIRTHKSLHIFVYTAKKVLESLPEVKFVIAGEGQESGMIKDLIHKLNLEKNIKYMGKVSEDKKISLYQSAWLFVNPSLMEGWGITTIEANACGTPVIASNVAGLRDSVYNPHSGILVPYGDVDEFAKNIKALIEDKDLRDAMSKEAIIWAKKFDWNKSAKAFSRIMNSSNNQKLS
jgi:glycosyltransferase involved in cell wall biosynthesis